MQIKYLGPADSVRVPPHGTHIKNQVKDYPDEFAADLLATSIKQRFVEVKPTKSKDKK